MLTGLEGSAGIADPDPPFRQPQGLSRQPNSPGGRQLFHTGRQVRGLADRGVIHVEVIANRPHDHCPGVQPHPDVDFEAVGAAHLVTVMADGVLHGERRIARAYRMVFVRNGAPNKAMIPSSMTWFTVPS